jgi:enoyl-CoA hydratase/carnithine racemase
MGFGSAVADARQNASHSAGLAATSIGVTPEYVHFNTGQNASFGLMFVTTQGRSDAEVGCELEGTVATLWLNRPAARNALSGGLVAHLSTVLATLDEDPRIHAAVLTGTAPGFCAGSDLKELAVMPIDGMVGHEGRTGRAARAIQHLGIPVIAAVEGFALGGGFLLATACDVVVTAKDARWHLPEVRLGWVPPWGLQSLIARTGLVTAKRLAWGDLPLTGEEAHRLGVVEEITDPGHALGHAREIAARLAALPPHAVVSAKRAFTTGGLAEALDAHTTRMFGEDCGSEAALASLTKFGRTSSGKH